MRDQAERLREIAEHLRQDPPPDVPGSLSSAAPAPVHRRARVIAVTSGKGGVGKTNLAVNLSYALLKLGHEVVVLDADLGLANVDVLLGTTPRWHLGHSIHGEKGILELMYSAPEGLKLIAGGSGLSELVDLPQEDLERFLRNLRELETQADFLVVDTGAGMGRSVMAFTLAADEVIVVTTPEPTAITDAYAVIKAIVRRQPAAKILLVVNQAQDKTEAEQAAQRLSATVLRFLDAHLELLGHIPYDQQVGRAVRNQTPFLLSTPGSPAGQAISQMARRITGQEEGARRTAPGVSLFFDRLGKFFSRGGKKD